MDSNVIFEPGSYGRDLREASMVGKDGASHDANPHSPYLKEKSEKQVISQGYSTVDLRAAYEGTMSEVGLPRKDNPLLPMEASEKNLGVKEDPFYGGR